MNTAGDRVLFTVRDARPTYLFGMVGTGIWEHRFGKWLLALYFNLKKERVLTLTAKGFLLVIPLPNKKAMG